MESWLSVSPTSGSGNGGFSASALSPHTGRVARTGKIQVQGDGVSGVTEIEATQSPLAEFVSFDNGATMSVGQTGGSVQVTGKTNSAKLKFEWLGSATDSEGHTVDPESGIDYPEVDLPAKYLADGVSTSNNTIIADDPGADAEIPFSISFTFPSNATADEVWRTLKVTANNGSSKQILIKQTASSAYLRVSPTQITIPQDGSAVYVTVESNTTWSVS